LKWIYLVIVLMVLLITTTTDGSPSIAPLEVSCATSNVTLCVDYFYTLDKLSLTMNVSAYVLYDTGNAGLSNVVLEIIDETIIKQSLASDKDSIIIEYIFHSENVFICKLTVYGWSSTTVGTETLIWTKTFYMATNIDTSAYYTEQEEQLWEVGAFYFELIIPVLFMGVCIKRRYVND